MSDTMLLGVLRMPIDFVGGPLSPMAQFVARAREAADRIESDADTIESLRTQLAEARAEAGALMADARRYRWLRDGCDTKGSTASRIAMNCYGLEWDAAIDAAMKERE